MANSHLSIHGSGRRLQHDRFYPLKKASTHNAEWGSFSSTQPVVVLDNKFNESSWPLKITLKEGTRQSLLRELGLKDREMPAAGSSNSKSSSQASLSLIMRKSATRLLSIASTKEILELPVGKERTMTALRSAKNLSSPNCGLRRSCHLLGSRRATVASLQPMPRASIFRQAVHSKQQQQQQS